MPFLAHSCSVRGFRHKDAGTPNEDAVCCNTDRGLFAAVDGVSRCPAGHEAARIVVEALLRLPTNAAPDAILLAQAFAEADHAMRVHMEENHFLRCPSAVVTAAWMQCNREGCNGVIGHAGDSTAFLIDHDRRRIDRLTLQDSIGPNVTRWIGNCMDAPQFFPLHVPANATVLLVTDGITKRIGDADLRSVVLRAPDVAAVTRRLVELAQQRNERDDISVVAFRS